MSPSSPCLCQICGNEFPPESQSGFYEKLTEWLDSHPTFTWSYFNQKATAPTLDPWTELETAHANFHEPFSSSDKISEQNPSPSPCASLPVSMRKISSHDFDFPEQLPILSASADGKPTFMPADFRRETLISLDSILPPRSSVSHDCATLPNERELINELVIDVCRELDITALCFKILQNVCTLVEADRGSLFLVDRNRSTGKVALVSKLFDVTPECSLAESLSRSEQRRVTIPLGVGVSGHVAQTGEYANIPDAYADPRFMDAVDRETGYKTKCILCMPIKDVDGTVLAVALVMNKRQRRRSSLTTLSAYSPKKSDAPSPETTGDLESFTDRDVRVFQSYVNFCGIGLHNAQIYQKSRLETYRNQILLELARIIFSEHSDISRLIYTVLLHTVSLLQCQRCQLLLVKEDSSLVDEPESPSSATFSHVFNITWSDRLDTIDLSNPTHSVENSRFPVHLELATHIVKTGESINLSDAPSDPRFDATLEADLELSWRTQALLCMPIKHWDGHVLAVCCLVNKGSKESKDNQQIGLSSAPSDDDSAEIQDSSLDWSHTFGQVDECLFEALALFAGLGIANRQTYDRVLRLVAKQRILLDVLSYHATAPMSEAKWLANSLIPSVRFFQLDQFTFTDIELSDETTLQATLRMFLEMRFMKTFKIEMLRLCRWILSVKKNYREVTYHNWRHAFNVTQTMFAVLMVSRICSIL
ncbi:hypothetical protein PHET_06132 [Paragonimus heterotremus]|uniref:PDEase domain-containing protein n=1 Tax=Paragonimus heterotremus TaxID=100268 RepID=A0A8J4WHP2_9TREM|nr:hypothetical protein PHET_06132 [Paragonimus heterotremus]